MPQDTYMSCFSEIFTAELKVLSTVIHNAIVHIFFNRPFHLQTGIFLIVEFGGLKIDNSPYFVYVVIEVILAEIFEIEFKLVKLLFHAL
jgi:hypothetical protein